MVIFGSSVYSGSLKKGVMPKEKGAMKMIQKVHEFSYAWKQDIALFLDFDGTILI